jgi:hypothetical protein
MSLLIQYGWVFAFPGQGIIVPFMDRYRGDDIVREAPGKGLGAA